MNLHIVVPSFCFNVHTQTTVFLLCTANKFGAYAAEPVEDDLVDVDAEEGAVTGEDAEADEDSDSGSSSSPNADTYLLFTKPLYTPGQQLDLPGGKPVEFLIGFTNKGAEEFLLKEPIYSEEVEQMDVGEPNEEEVLPKPQLVKKLMPKPEMGKKLINIQEICLKNTKIEHKKLLDEVAAENGCNITYVDIDEASFTGKFQCLVMISTSPVGICHGTGASVEEAQSNAAQNCLEFLKIVSLKGKIIEQAIAKLN